MTGNNNNINQYKGFIPSTPKTETRIILEIKEQSNLSKFASYLGIKIAECSGSSDDKSKEVVAKAQNTFASLSSYSPTERKDISSTLANTTGRSSEQEYNKSAGNEKTGDYASESISYKKK